MPVLSDLARTRPGSRDADTTVAGVLAPVGIWAGLAAAERVEAARHFPDKQARLHALDRLFGEQMKEEVLLAGETA
jgi:hypothetical protein